MLSFLIHLSLILLFVHVTYYVPRKQAEERAAASILIQDEGGSGDRLKYQDKDLVDQVRRRERPVFPHPDAEYFPNVPKMDFHLDTPLRDELDLIRVESPDLRFADFTAGPQPYYAGTEELAGRFARHIRGMRRKGLDIVFVFDSTGSMGLYVVHVKRKIRSLVRAIRKLVPAARVGLVTYRDVGMDFVTRAVQLTHGTRALEAFLQEIDWGGGGDPAEAVYEGLKVAVEEMNWRKDADKVIVLIGDAPPHEADLDETVRLVQRFREKMGGRLAAVDTNRPVFLRNQYQGCPPGGAVPCDIVLHGEVMETFKLLAETGGGESLRFNDMERMNEVMVMLIFGADWKDYLDVFVGSL